MRTHVADTSVAAYDAIKADGTISKRQSQILAVMKEDKDYSLTELVKLSGIPINVVSGRVKELKDAGFLEYGETRACSQTKRTVHPVKLVCRQNSLLDLN